MKTEDILAMQEAERGDLPNLRVVTHQTREVQVVYEVCADSAEEAYDKALSGNYDEVSITHLETSYTQLVRVEEIKNGRVNR